MNVGEDVVFFGYGNVDFFVLYGSFSFFFVLYELFLSGVVVVFVDVGGLFRVFFSFFESVICFLFDLVEYLVEFVVFVLDGFFNSFLYRRVESFKYDWFEEVE